MKWTPMIAFAVLPFFAATAALADAVTANAAPAAETAAASQPAGDVDNAAHPHPHARHHGARYHARHHHHHARDADQGVCQRQNAALAQGPLGLTFQAGAFGAPRRVCPKSEVGLALRAPVAAEIGRELFTDLVGDVPTPVLDVLDGREQFYVNATAGTAITLAWAPLSRVELFLEIEAFRFQYVRASTTSTAMGFGHLSPGATFLVAEGRDYAVGVTGRAQLPTATGFYRHTFPFALDVGAQVLVQPLPFLRLHGYLGGSGAVALGAVADARGGLVGVAGAEILPFDWLAFVADLNGRALYDDTLDHLALGLGVRAAIFSTVGLEGGLLIPLAGSERALTALMVRATWRLGDLSVQRLMRGDVRWDEAILPQR